MTGPLLHVDADAFFASVAMRSRPDLADRPVAVVAHVFIASANYAARARGVKSAMFAHDAQRLCPELVLLDVPTDIEETSEALFDIFGEVALAVEPGSVEEGFLDVGATDWQSAHAAGVALRRTVRERLGIAVSVGIGRTKLMAKLASRGAKPDGIRVIRDAEEQHLRENLPMKDVWGVGRTTRDNLALIGVTTLRDLDAIGDDELHSVCGTGMARRLRGIREGTDDATVRSPGQRTTMTAELQTAGFERPDHTPTRMVETCVARVCRRAERAGLVASGITVLLRTPEESADRTLKAHLPQASADPDVWLPLALDLLRDDSGPRPHGLRVTLTGLLTPERAPQTLF